ncbi:AAA family ATPase [Leptolyngbya sp. FACHB-541]|uniref:AAA family ATPase n=1 Tax=Leptolyngbya sp. FACHB-541 TaxID=2692810 RepID=UPI00168A0830|nr:ATP-binding protein [Leptolyngbya sp. FACHB-541]MBD1998031.1 AAA family ATPase [Leptolyngbya sp. FACHB-541]
MITRLELTDFTVFTKLEVDFSPKINLIVGHNGTGKTHLLKAAYSLCAGATIFKDKPDASKAEIQTAITTKLLRLFTPIEGKLGKLRRYGAKKNAQMQAHFALGGQLKLSFHSNSKALTIQDSTDCSEYQSAAIYIPTKEVLSLIKGISNKEHDPRTVELIFDASYLDLVANLMRPSYEDPEAELALDPRFSSIVPMLVNLIGGKYCWEGGDFYFQSGSYEEKADPDRPKGQHAQSYQDSTVARFKPTKDPVYASSMTAEGFRKIGILHRLLCNGTLNPGVSGPLFWDEPESNLNPKMMKHLVQVLLELSRNGQQIILATHDYVLLKWFDLLMDKGKEDHVRFHALYRDAESQEIRIESMDDYNLISKSAISDTFAELYDADVRRALE